MTERVSQTKAIRKYLEEHGSITLFESMQYFDCYRLSARIKELRSVMKIETLRIPYVNWQGIKKRRTVYRMVE